MEDFYLFLIILGIVVFFPSVHMTIKSEKLGSSKFQMSFSSKGRRIRIKLKHIKTAAKALRKLLAAVFK